jgi:hypothetical protein
MPQTRPFLHGAPTHRGEYQGSTVRHDTTLHAGDDLLILAADKEQPELAAIFEQPDDPRAPVAST